MSNGSYDLNLGSEMLILVGDIRSRSWPNIGGTYGIWKRPGFTKLCTEAHPQRIAQLYFALMISLLFFSQYIKLCIDWYFFSVPPEIIDAESSTSTVNIRENYNASLICKATGTPEPEITWKREDGRKIVIKRKKNNGKKGN